MDHFQYATVCLRQLHFRSATDAHCCYATLAVRAVQGAINSPDAILQHRFKGSFGFVFPRRQELVRPQLSSRPFWNRGRSRLSARGTELVPGQRPEQRNIWLDGFSWHEPSRSLCPESASTDVNRRYHALTPASLRKGVLSVIAIYRQLRLTGTLAKTVQAPQLVAG